MFKNYLKVILRNILKEKYYTSINVFGLALGISCTLLIFRYLNHELSYDNFHPDVERTYRVNQTNIWSPDGGVMGSTGIPVAQVLADEYPEIEEVTRINTPGNQLIGYASDSGDYKSFYESNIFAADSNFFSFFEFKLSQGDPKTALVGLNKVVISGEMAQKYFGDGTALGKTLLLGDKRVPLLVTGITADQPTNAHFQFDFMLSMYTNPKIRQFEWSWIWTQVVTYVRLRKEADPVLLTEKLKNVANNHARYTFQRINMDYDEFIKEKGAWEFYLQPVKDIHLYSVDIGNRLGTVSDIRYIYIFGSIAVLVLLLGCINFMNLSTARAADRAKEIGVRKTLGSPKKYLIAQFLTESLIMSFIATFIGFGLTELMHIYVSDWLGFTFKSSFVFDFQFIAFIIGLPLLTGLLAGIYPAFYLTKFEPVKVLKGKLSSGMKNSGMRNFLVVFQFTISIMLIVSTLIVQKQLNYFQSKNLGFDKENVLTINWAEKLGNSIESFRNDLLSLNGVNGVTVSQYVPGTGSYEDLFIKEVDQSKISMSTLKADSQFFNIMGMELLIGRKIVHDAPSDNKSIIINETTMRLLGWDQSNVIGQHIGYAGDDIGHFEVVGVVKDFNFQSLRFPIAPMSLISLNAPFWGDSRTISLKVKPSDLDFLIPKIEEKWKNYVAEAPINYSFLNEEFDTLYRSEQKLGSLFTVFTFIAIFIACLGLLALATFTVRKRRKEIGIRKVMGSGVYQLVWLLNGNFSKLIILAIAIGSPLGWWAMRYWLQQFAYQTEIDLWIFLVAAVSGLVITWMTVSVQSFRAARANPVDALKEE